MLEVLQVASKESVIPTPRIRYRMKILGALRIGRKQYEIRYSTNQLERDFDPLL
jgi:hypothetical protein